MQTLKGHSAKVSGVAITPDGRRAISASDDKTLRVWDLESGQDIRTLEGHTGSVNGVAITPDGRRAVSASLDWTLRVWDIEAGKELTVFTGDAGMLSCAFSPDCQTVASGDESGRMHFLRLVEADPTKPSVCDTKIQLLRREEPATHS
jgi:WD40 repeat protein